MPARLRAPIALGLGLCVLALAGEGDAKSPIREQVIQEPIPHFDGEFGPQARFVSIDTAPLTLQGAHVGGTQAPASASTDEALRGGPIAVLAEGTLVADADSGRLVRTDDNGNPVADLEIGAGVSQLVVDAKAARAYVVDRAHDRVAVVDLARGLKIVDAFTTDAEPYGIALSPDRRTLLVTTVADQGLAAYEVATGLRRWTIDVGPEPRGVAISPTGDEALVTFLGTGAVARVSLAHTPGGKGRPKVSYVTIDPPTRSARVQQQRAGQVEADEGRSFARSAFAVQYLGNDVAVVPHQLSTPHLATDEFRGESSGYGGGDGFTPPVAHRLAFLQMPDAGRAASTVRTAMATTNLHQPRATAYDGRTDTLYVAGFGSDDVLAIADVSQASIRSTWQHSLGEGCGPSGLAVDPDDGHVVAWCSLTRQVVRLSGDPALANPPTEVVRSPELAASRLSKSAQRGRELFRRGKSPVVSTAGAMACASCHPEARADGLSWRLQGNNLQTPLLAGRITDDAHPFKWDGKDPDITASLTNTVKRLGGDGISSQQAQDLAAFLEGLEPPRTPTVDDGKAVARGKKLFESDAVGCLSCHSGALMTDQNQYPIASDLAEVDTPSLVGLAVSAPYYHDGSAATLEALLRDNGTVHDMGDLDGLTDAQISDLVRYLKTL